MPFLSALKAAKQRFSSPVSTANHVGKVETRESQRTGSRGISRAALHDPPPSADRHDPGEQRGKPNETIHRMQSRQHTGTLETSSPVFVNGLDPINAGNMALQDRNLEEEPPEMNDHPTRNPSQNRWYFTLRKLDPVLNPLGILGRVSPTRTKEAVEDLSDS